MDLTANDGAADAERTEDAQLHLLQRLRAVAARADPQVAVGALAERHRPRREVRREHSDFARERVGELGVATAGELAIELPLERSREAPPDLGPLGHAGGEHVLAADLERDPAKLLDPAPRGVAIPRAPATATASTGVSAMRATVRSAPLLGHARASRTARAIASSRAVSSSAASHASSRATAPSTSIARSASGGASASAAQELAIDDDRQPAGDGGQHADRVGLLEGEPQLAAQARAAQRLEAGAPGERGRVRLDRESQPRGERSRRMIRVGSSAKLASWNTRRVRAARSSRAPGAAITWPSTVTAIALAVKSRRGRSSSRRARSTSGSAPGAG